MDVCGRRGEPSDGHVGNQCRFCSNMFPTRQELHIHLLTHVKGKLSDLDSSLEDFMSSPTHDGSTLSPPHDNDMLRPTHNNTLSSSNDSVTSPTNDGSASPKYEHVTVQTDERPKPYKCSVCGSAYAVKTGLMQHLPAHGEQAHMCTVCGLGFTLKEMLQEHLPDHIGDPLQMCTQCGKGFTTKLLLTQHIKVVHKGRRSNSCDVCGRNFNLMVTLKRHMLNHIGQPLHTCSQCGQGFSTDRLLSQHKQLVHLGMRSHFCDVCGKGFSQKGLLLSHMLNHIGEELHMCSQCGQGFKAPHILTQHIESVHTGERAHLCEICGKGFKTKPILKQHMITHTGERPHKCNVCGKAFASRGTLSGHALIHSRRRALGLPECSRQTRKRMTLRQKAELIKAASDGKSHRELADLYQIGKTSVQGIMKRKDDIMHLFQTSPDPDRRRERIIGKGMMDLTELDRRVFEWFSNRRAMNLEVKGPMIKEKALEIAAELGHTTFTASGGWLSRFRYRHHLSSPRGSGGPKSVKDPNKKPQKKPPSHKCSACGKTFKRKHELTEHMMLTHTEERPREGYLCWLGIGNGSQLPSHMLGHNGQFSQPEMHAPPPMTINAPNLQQPPRPELNIPSIRNELGAPRNDLYGKTSSMSGNHHLPQYPHPSMSVNHMPQPHVGNDLSLPQPNVANDLSQHHHMSMSRNDLSIPQPPQNNISQQELLGDEGGGGDGCGGGGDGGGGDDDEDGGGDDDDDVDDVVGETSDLSNADDLSSDSYLTDSDLSWDGFLSESMHGTDEAPPRPDTPVATMKPRPKTTKYKKKKRTTVPGERKFRKELNIREKVELLNNSEGKSQRQLADIYNIAKSSVQSILKKREKILRVFETSTNPNQVRSRSNKSSAMDLSAMDERVFQWVSNRRAQNLEVNGPMIRKKALEVAAEMGHTAFTASGGWLSRFKSRHFLSFPRGASKKGTRSATKKPPGSGKKSAPSAKKAAPSMASMPPRDPPYLIPAGPTPPPMPPAPPAAHSTSSWNPAYFLQDSTHLLQAPSHFLQAPSHLLQAPTHLL